MMTLILDFFVVSFDFFRNNHYRAGLQLIIHAHTLLSEDALSTFVNLGHLNRTAFEDGFVHYARCAFKKLGLSREFLDSKGVTDAALEEYQSQFKQREMEVPIMWTLRALMGAVIESLILVDRFIMLEEKQDGDLVDIDFSLFPLFDPETSPRNCVLVAVKK